MKCLLLSINNIDEDYIFESMKDIIKPEMKVLCIPFASDLNWIINNEKTELVKYGNFWTQHYNPFKKYGISEENFYIAKLRDNEYDIKNKILESDIIYFSGGYMEKAMKILHHYNLIDYILTYADSKIFIGESAGALIMQDQYTEVPFIESAYKRYHKEKGMGLINIMNIIVHYDRNNKKHKLNSMILKIISGNKKVICLTNNGGILIDGDEIKYLGEVYD